MARQYYYDTGEKKVGPVSGDDLLRLRASGELAEDTWVRAENSSTWRPLASVDLRKEEQEAANPSLWKLLLRHVPLSSLLLGVAVLVVLVAVFIFFIGAFWPVLLALVLVWLLMGAARTGR